MPKATKDKPLSLTNCSIALAAAVIGYRCCLFVQQVSDYSSGAV